MKNLTKILFVFILLFSLQNTGIAQTTYTWNLGGNGSYATSTNWTPTRTTPAANDILLISDAGTHSISNVPTQTIGRLSISNNTTVLLSAAAGITLTVGDVTGTDLSVATGSSLTLSTNVSLTLSNDASADINGSLIINAGRTYNTNNTNVVTTVAGTITNNGTLTCATATKLLFQASSIYNHAQNGGTIPTATWNTTSACNITGLINTYPAGAGQSFGNFSFSSTPTSNTEMSSSLSCNNFTMSNGGAFALYLTNGGTSRTITVGGDFTMSSGNLTIVSNTGTGGVSVTGNFNMSNGTFVLKEDAGAATLDVTGNMSITGGAFNVRTTSTTSTATINANGNFSLSTGTLNMSSIGAVGTLNVKGNFTHTSGSITETSTGSGAIIFNGTGTQTYTSGGTLANTINFTVNSAVTLQMGTAASPAVISNGSSGTFTLSGGATLGITSSAGITSSGATGNIQVTGTRTYNTTSNYLYNGNTAQATGNGLPATVNNLTINNAAGVTQTNAAILVNGTLDLSSGIYTSGANTITVGSAGFPSATITNASSSNYVSGILAKYYSAAASFTFPIGKGGNYRPVTFEYVTLTGASTVTINQLESALTTGTPALPFQHSGIRSLEFT